MARITLITGGSRSGKSGFAQRLAEQASGPRLFLATCPVTDSEMAGRIARHVLDRRHSDWQTIEELIDLAGCLDRSPGYGIVLVDCLTLWISNLLHEAMARSETMDEDSAGRAAGQLLDAARRHPGDVLIVTNEVGMGIVPENRLARLYRDLVGRCNQLVGAGADTVFLVSCGIPLRIKGKDDEI